MKFISLFLTLVVVTTVVLPTASLSETCDLSKAELTRYSNESRGEVTLYTAVNNEDLHVTNLVCILGTEFFSKVYNFPTKATVGIVNSEYTNVLVLQWNISQDYFLIVQVVSGEGSFLKYPRPLDRIKEILINSPMPKKEELPPHLQRKFSSNTLKAPPELIKKLIVGN